MQICRIIGDIVSTQKNPEFKGHKLLIVEPVNLDKTTSIGNSMIAVDIVNAGKDDLVLVNKEGSSARLVLDNENIPVQAIIIGIIDDIDVPK